jgi:hypothetical protein
MPLIRNINIEDPRFAKHLDLLDHRIQFIHELAKIILPEHEGFESVWSIANRVYDRHSSPWAGSRDRRRFDQPARTALSA